MAERTRLQTVGLLAVCVSGIYASYLTQGWLEEPLSLLNADLLLHISTFI